ncbi:MAG TPA: hypothetical protein VKB05_11335 [Pyrinomonadaceae bacterium]|nr:hypothetical protein [Pyrinomonadaceae bacterium]
MVSRSYISGLKRFGTMRHLAIVVLQGLMILLIIGAGWLIYRRMPARGSEAAANQQTTDLQIVIRQTPESVGPSLDVAVSLYPVDIIAVRHEYFTEPPKGKRFEDFLKERMKGRSPVNARLDKQGHGSVSLAPGNWWLHATLSGDEQLEWRLPVTIVGSKQVIELTPQNAYTRSKTF